MKMRPFKTYDEIKGVHPKKRYERKVIHDSLNYSDLNIKKKSNRHTNPLEPDYDNKYGGYIDGTKPYLPFYHYFKDGNKDNINVQDIEGANYGSVNRYNNFRYDNKQRFDPRDIDGGYSGTRKNGITTGRCTNPLKPNYKYLGDHENFDSFGERMKVDRDHNNSMINPTIKKYEQYTDNLNQNNNNNNHLVYSYDFYNMPPSDRRKRMVHKSLSCEKMTPQLPSLYSKKINNRESIKYKLLDENEKNLSEVNNNRNFPFYKDSQSKINLKTNNIIMRNNINYDTNKTNKSYVINRRLNADDEMNIINSN